MASLKAIGYTLGGGTGIMVISFISFGVANRCRSAFIAPRCTARPPETIFNPNPTHPSQSRGNPVLGWIHWLSGLSYETLIHGVPGTGTRNGGLEGDLLKVNLDGIVLLRFVALCTKLTGLISVLCMVIFLPTYLTARCNTSAREDGLELGCFNDGYNLTDYGITTLANVPDLELEPSGVVLDVSQSDIFARLYVVVLLFWFICYYSCKTMEKEWKAMLALRRVYFLEADVFNERKGELAETLLKGAPEEQMLPESKQPSYLKRDPWIPHAEQREVVPNISLYSVLVGGIPASPDDERHIEDVEAALKQSRKSKIDWQLAYVGEYFDKCVPNQPGYSSSVAAITILPSAPHLARAWSKWYAAAGKLRRLRFIRKVINDRMHYSIDVDDDDNGDEKKKEDDDGEEKDEEKGAEKDKDRHSSLETEKHSSWRVYKDSERNKAYYRDIFGASPEEIASSVLDDDFGPEQTAAYSREFAQSAAACCPNGCCEGWVRRARIDRLREMEADAEVEVHAANTALKKAQRRVMKHMEKSEHSAMFGRQDGEEIEDDADSDDDSHQKTILRHPSFRAVVGVIGHAGKLRRRVQEGSKQWSRIESMINEQIHSKRPELNRRKSQKQLNRRKLETGVWKLPSMFKIGTQKAVEEMVGQGTEISKDIRATVEDHLLRESTYAVVTFTSRQAAVAARQCLTDGRGLNRWETFSRIPIPPLADAAPWLMCPCRGCCRPVTLTIHDRQKTIRKYIALLALGTMYVSYTFPLLAATNLVAPDRLGEFSPEIKGFLEDNVLFSRALSGVVPALIYSTFFALCPVIFKFIANFGSNAASVYVAEYTAMQYYWYFMVVTAFTNNLLWNMVLQATQTGLNIGSGLTDVVREVAATLPTVISATWLNWCILRTTTILPLQYLLQFNTFLFTALGWKCCARMVRGGGPGGPVPYRIYIDSGVVFLCSVALAPAAPLVAPITFLYFFLGAPILKRNLIFMYRPKYDAGGRHWPFLFDMMISSLVVGQIMMTTMMALRRAVGPAVLAGVTIPPTIMFRLAMRNRYLRAYRDASLFHTSELDGWDVDEKTSVKQRQEYRKFIVDAHKAAYVPVCLANSDEVLTVEPALVVPLDRDETESPEAPVCKEQKEDEEESLSSNRLHLSREALSRSSISRASISSRTISSQQKRSISRSSNQFGVSVRRIAPSIALSMKSSGSSELARLSSVLQDDPSVRGSSSERQEKKQPDENEERLTSI